MAELTPEQEQAREQIFNLLSSFSKDDRATILYECWLDAFYDSNATEETIDQTQTTAALVNHILDHSMLIDKKPTNHQEHLDTHKNLRTSQML